MQTENTNPYSVVYCFPGCSARFQQVLEELRVSGPTDRGKLNLASFFPAEPLHGHVSSCESPRGQLLATHSLRSSSQFHALRSATAGYREPPKAVEQESKTAKALWEVTVEAL